MIGEAKTEIVRKATEIKADALIMGSRQMGTIKRYLLFYIEFLSIALTVSL